MIIQREFLLRLKDFGLNSYEAKLWMALLSRGVATAGELSDIANVPRSRSYDVLESLERKGFVILKIGKPIKYIAVPPSEVLERVKKNIAEESQHQQELLNTLKGSKILQELAALHRSGGKVTDAEDVTGAVRGKHNIINHFNSLFRNAQKSIHMITTEPSISFDVEQFSSALAKARQRGITVQMIIPETKHTNTIAKNIQHAAEIKSFKDSLGRFCIIDEKSMNFYVDETEQAEFCVWINTPFVARSFATIFNKLWNTAQPTKQ